MSEELATLDNAQLEAIAAAQEGELDAGLFQTPILKIGQPLTREVQDEQAEPGEFINTLTGEGLGDKLGFIVAFYNKGRFASDQESGRAYVSFDDAIPPAWADLVGEEFVGTPFVEHPDAEERFKARVNAKEIEWGSGPLISTTHNYTGYAIVPAIEGSDDPDDLQPVRLSLQRTNIPAARKFTTIKRAVLRNKPFWDIVFDLSTYKKPFDRGTAHLLSVRQGRKTTSEERSLAAELAAGVLAGQVAANDDAAGDAPSAPAVEPDAKGGAAL